MPSRRPRTAYAVCYDNRVALVARRADTRLDLDARPDRVLWSMCRPGFERVAGFAPQPGVVYRITIGLSETRGS